VNSAWPDVVTAGVAGAALALSILGLVVQWLMWTRSGAVIEVEASHAVLTAGPVAAAITITALNKGRGTAQITSWWIEPVGAPSEAKKWWLNHLGLPGSAELPVMIEGEHQVVWLVPHEALEESCRRWNVTRVRPCISLGSGRKIAGKALTIV
jgi:hypothetical protein